MKIRMLPCALLAFSLAFSLAVAGCAQPATPVMPGSGIQVVAPGEGTVTATMQLSVQDTFGRRVLAPSGVEPWKKADIDHVKLSLYKAGDLIVSTTVAQASLSGTVTFANLHLNADYQVVAEAWTVANERIDAGETEPASCTTSFSTTNAEQVDAGAIQLKLRAKVFSGTTTGSTIQVTDGIVESTPATETVTVVEPSTISSLSPAGGSIFGGGPLTINGTNLEGTTSVTIGGASASSFTVVSPTQVVATTPAGVAGTVDVVLTTANGTVTAAGAYTYANPPSVNWPGPLSGTTGESITLTGSNLTGATVTLGGVDVVIQSNTATSITFTVPDPVSPYSNLDVAVTTFGGSNTLAGGFSFF